MPTSRSRRASNYQEFYDQEAHQYDERRYATRYGRLFKELHHQTISRTLAQVTPGARVLEVACGTGYLTDLLADGYRNVVAVDFSSEMMRIARERCSTRKVSFAEADALVLPFADETFDLTAASRLLHLFGSEDQSRILSEFGRVTRPGGLVVVDFDNSASRWLLSPLLLLYNLLRYRRLRPDTHYNSARGIGELFSRSGLVLREIDGIGGYLLLLPALVSTRLARRCAALQERSGIRLLTEQLLVVGVRQ